jgi:hypothetical protein
LQHTERTLSSYSWRPREDKVMLYIFFMDWSHILTIPSLPPLYNWF